LDFRKLEMLEMMNSMVRTAVPCLTVIAMALAMAPRPAEACGGTFCNGVQPTPVDQTGENILFVWEGDAVEAHIQIQYAGEATQFGWVIPLQSLPEFSVGSEPLFTALLNSSVPTLTINQTFDQCEDPDSGNNGSATNASGFDDGGGETGSAGDDDTGGGVEVLQEVQVGAFAIDVIQGSDAQAVYDWLEANEYQQDPDALPILQEYIDEGFIFGAVKLVGGVETDQIHPIVLRFDGSEPCVPLRLTRIAAVENMAVRSFFLAAERMVPSNYRHVLVNQAKLDWVSVPPAMNYNDVVTLAVDEENADGRAFVTEYAGPSSIVDTSTVYNPAWDPSAFQAIDPATQLLDVLQQQQLVDCFGETPPNFTPGWLHPLIEPLLGEFITVDAGELIDAVCGAGSVDDTLWDGDMFAQQMTLRIVEPGMHAADVVAQNPYLTRMFTTISPGEMTVDPIFYENPDLEEVTNQLIATRRFLCNNDNVWTLPDGREVYLPAGAAWPDFPDEPEGAAGMMDAAELVSAMPPSGAPMTLTENTPRIDAVILAWNEQFEWPGGAMPDTGGPDTGDGGSADTGDTGEGGQDGDGGSDSGCSCTTDRSSAKPSSALLLLVSIAALRRRRRRA
jgi:MYXO-CTERM domain-containing protein